MKTALKGIAGSACEIPFWPKDGGCGRKTALADFDRGPPGRFVAKPDTCPAHGPAERLI